MNSASNTDTNSLEQAIPVRSAQQGLAAALQALEMNALDAESRRGNKRFALNIGLNIWAGNMRDRDDQPIKARCQDLSDSGCRILCDKPLNVGDVYLTQFDQDNEYQVDSVYVRCIRCHMLGETKFEVGFSFLSPVNIKQRNAPGQASSIID